MRKNNRWERVVIDWDIRPSSLKTKLPSEKGKEGDKLLSLSDMRAVSLPEREVLITLGLRPHTFSRQLRDIREDPTGIGGAIYEKIRTTLDSKNLNTSFVGRRQDPENWGDVWTAMTAVVLSLKDGQQFLESTLDFAQEWFEQIGIEDGGHHSLSGFSIKSRETLIVQDGGWILFEDSLRMERRLPLKDSRLKIYTVPPEAYCSK